MWPRHGQPACPEPQGHVAWVLTWGGARYRGGVVQSESRAQWRCPTGCRAGRMANMIGCVVPLLGRLSAANDVLLLSNSVYLPGISTRGSVPLYCRLPHLIHHATVDHCVVTFLVLSSRGYVLRIAAQPRRSAFGSVVSAPAWSGLEAPTRAQAVLSSHAKNLVGTGWVRQ